MSTNIESAETSLDKFKAGQTEALLSDLDPDCIWVSPEGSQVPGTFTGLQEILQKFFMPLGERFELSIEVDSYHDAGDAVVVRGTYDTWFGHRYAPHGSDVRIGLWIGGCEASMLIALDGLLR